MVDTIPLKKDSSPSSNLGFFRLPFPLALSRAAAALFSFASVSSPSREVLGVGGSRGLAGCLNVWC
jgi:hypothetical protein